MIAFAFRRFVWSIPVFLGVSIITFVLMHLVPGGPWDAISAKPLPPRIQIAIARKYGLDKPFTLQYLDYMLAALHGDLGPSYSDTRLVNEIIASDFPLSAAFGSGALLAGIAVGVPLGLATAINRNSILDRIATLIVSINMAIPRFVLAILLILVFGVDLHLLPVQYQRHEWQSWILPLLLLSLSIIALTLRFTRAAALDILGEDYIRTARMKGLPNALIMRRHIMRNALLPVITLVGPLAADLLTGSFIVESIFGIPGLGKAFVTSITSRDYPLLMGTALFYSLLLIGLNLLVDISYSVIDPRIVYA